MQNCNWTEMTEKSLNTTYSSEVSKFPAVKDVDLESPWLKRELQYD